MNDDVRRYIYGAVIVFLVGLMAWVALIFVNACGFSLACNRGALPVDRTPVPTLIPATMPAMEMQGSVTTETDTCYIAAVDLIGAWVEADSSETEAFQFTDANGQNCEATFEAVLPLFVESNLWYSGSLSCISCHSVDVAISPAQLDVSSYAGIIAGSHRADTESNGTDILGAGRWTSSILYEFLTEARADVPGHTEALSGLMVYAGTPLPELEETPVP